LQCFQSTGRPDPNCPATGKLNQFLILAVANAWNAGMAHVDVYFFPCYFVSTNVRTHPLGSAEIQLVKFKQQFPSCKATVLNLECCGNYNFQSIYDYCRFDIEGSQYWSSSHSANSEFMGELISEARNHGLNIGIYTSASQWNPIMGSYTGASGWNL
jgi:hypothetical protein